MEKDPSVRSNRKFYIAAALHLLVSIAPLVHYAVYAWPQAIALAIAAHVPAAYGILRGRLWALLAMPAGWLAAFVALRYLHVSPARAAGYSAAASPIGNPLGFTDDLLVLVGVLLVAVLLEIVLALALAIARVRRKWGDEPDRWIITLRELLAGMLLFAVSSGLDATLIAGIKAWRWQNF